MVHAFRPLVRDTSDFPVLFPELYEALGDRWEEFAFDVTASKACIEELLSEFGVTVSSEEKNRLIDYRIQKSRSSASSMYSPEALEVPYDADYPRVTDI